MSVSVTADQACMAVQPTRGQRPPLFSLRSEPLSHPKLPKFRAERLVESPSPPPLPAPCPSPRPRRGRRKLKETERRSMRERPAATAMRQGQPPARVLDTAAAAASAQPHARLHDTPPPPARRRAQGTNKAVRRSTPPRSTTRNLASKPVTRSTHVRCPTESFDARARCPLPPVVHVRATSPPAARAETPRECAGGWARCRVLRSARTMPPPRRSSPRRAALAPGWRDSPADTTCGHDVRRCAPVARVGACCAGYIERRPVQTHGGGAPRERRTAEVGAQAEWHKPACARAKSASAHARSQAPRPRCPPHPQIGRRERAAKASKKMQCSLCYVTALEALRDDALKAQDRLGEDRGVCKLKTNKRDLTAFKTRVDDGLFGLPRVVFLPFTTFAASQVSLITINARLMQASPALEWMDEFARLLRLARCFRAPRMRTVDPTYRRPASGVKLEIEPAPRAHNAPSACPTNISIVCPRHDELNVYGIQLSFGHLGQLVCAARPANISMARVQHLYCSTLLRASRAVDLRRPSTSRDTCLHYIEVQDPNSILNSSSVISGSSILVRCDSVFRIY
ncbi:hypothetical protein FB451DRAFT_1361411 [Mycena latifolia]|nr:hypothetical protein FB451DRAFT_1361411 [Mycena latifolia]